MKKPYTHVFLAGTFDLFHIGHQWFLWQALAQAERATIVIAQDETVRSIKGFLPHNTQTERRNRVQTEVNDLPTVHVTIGQSKQNMLQTFKKASPDLLFLGYDQHAPEAKIREILPSITIQRATPYAPHIFKSSHFRTQKRP